MPLKLNKTIEALFKIVKMMKRQDLGSGIPGLGLGLGIELG